VDHFARASPLQQEQLHPRHEAQEHAGGTDKTQQELPRVLQL
jgi:hypothetical protein